MSDFKRILPECDALGTPKQKLPPCPACGADELMLLRVGYAYCTFCTQVVDETAEIPFRVVFLDMDGVLNGHDYDGEAVSSTVRPECVKHLNRVLKVTGAKVVLSSAWRYMIHQGAMTLRGFEYLLRTHGVVYFDLIAVTPPDEESPCRWRQIEFALAALPKSPASWVIFDDCKGCFETPPPESQVVWTDGNIGMTAADADAAIAILKEQPHVR